MRAFIDFIIKHINQIKSIKVEMEKKITFLDNLYNFSLVKFQPGDIVLVHKHTRDAFTFHAIESQKMLPEISHPCLSRPILYKNGALYRKGDSKLSIELDNKRRFSEKEYFTIQELSNTFIPVVECIEYLHQEGVIHGCISSDSILFFENGEILVKDWLIPTQSNKYYPGNEAKNMADDMRALGLIIAEAATLEKIDISSFKSINSILSKIKEKYKNQFCYGLIILLFGMNDKFNHVASLFSCEESNFIDEAVLKIYDSCQDSKPKMKIQEKFESTTIRLIQVRQHKQKYIKIKKQPIKESKLSNYSEVPFQKESPVKKFQKNKKISKADQENKKYFNQDAKKRQIQKITKIIERSNAFVNELMTKKNNEKEKKNQNSKNSNSLNQANSNFQNAANLKKPCVKEVTLASPSKKMRTIIKKK